MEEISSAREVEFASGDWCAKDEGAGAQAVGKWMCSPRALESRCRQGRSKTRTAWEGCAKQLFWPLKSGALCSGAQSPRGGCFAGAV